MQRTQSLKADIYQKFWVCTVDRPIKKIIKQLLKFDLGQYWLYQPYDS